MKKKEYGLYSRVLYLATLPVFEVSTWSWPKLWDVQGFFKWTAVKTLASNVRSLVTLLFQLVSYPMFGLWRQEHET